jgi:hypothetical protein
LCIFAKNIRRTKLTDGYIIDLNESELEILRWKFSTAKLSKTRTLPKVFTERELYMLATILYFLLPFGAGGYLSAQFK